MTHEIEPDTEHEVWDELPDADEFEAVPLDDVEPGSATVPEVDVDVDAVLAELDEGPADE